MKKDYKDWEKYIGKYFIGKRTGKYLILRCDEYNGRIKQWKKKQALFIKSLSSAAQKEYPLMIDVLVAMKDNFVPSNNSMDSAFGEFCIQNKIPNLPSQNTVESYYVSFYNNFLTGSVVMTNVNSPLSTQADDGESLENAIERMAKTAISTTNGANGQEVLAKIKDKKFMFLSEDDLKTYISNLIKKQKGRCALTGLELALDGKKNDPELVCSLDRIDSNKDYEKGNLQVVCKFVNRWKGSGDNDEFQRLIQLVMTRGKDGVKRQ